MSLRTKLLVRTSCLVVTLAALGGWSAWRLEQAGAVSQRILSENYESVVAAQSMKESLERLDSATLFAELGRTDRARASARRAPPAVRCGVRSRGGQHHRAGRGRDHRRRFAGSATNTTGSSTDGRLLRAHRAAVRHPARDVDRLLQINQAAMLRKSADAQRVTGRSILMTVLLSATLVIAGLASLCASPRKSTGTPTG